MRIVFARYRDLRVVRFAIRQELIANRFNFFFGKEHRSGFLGGSIEDVDLPEAGHRTAVADSVGLSRLAFAVISCPVQFVGSLFAPSRSISPSFPFVISQKVWPPNWKL